MNDSKDPLLPDKMPSRWRRIFSCAWNGLLGALLFWTMLAIVIPTWSPIWPWGVTLLGLSITVAIGNWLRLRGGTWNSIHGRWHFWATPFLIIAALWAVILQDRITQGTAERIHAMITGKEVLAILGPPDSYGGVSEARWVKARWRGGEGEILIEFTVTPAPDPAELHLEDGWKVEWTHWTPLTHVSLKERLRYRLNAWLGQYDLDPW